MTKKTLQRTIINNPPLHIPLDGIPLGELYKYVQGLSTSCGKSNMDMAIVYGEPQFFSPVHTPINWNIKRHQLSFMVHKFIWLMTWAKHYLGFHGKFNDGMHCVINFTSEFHHNIRAEEYRTPILSKDYSKERAMSTGYDFFVCCTTGMKCKEPKGFIPPRRDRWGNVIYSSGIVYGQPQMNSPINTPLNYDPQLAAMMHHTPANWNAARNTR